MEPVKRSGHTHLSASEIERNLNTRCAQAAKNAKERGGSRTDPREEMTSTLFFNQAVAFILWPRTRGNEINATFDLCELRDFCSNFLDWLVFRCVCPREKAWNNAGRG
jgi:hypothetical protein